MSKPFLFHECESIMTSNDISIQKLNETWVWVFLSDNIGIQAHGIRYCPYCGEKLTKEEA